MKKHRNFIIFYSLWLAAIFVMFVAFDTTQDQDVVPMNETKSVCSLEKKSTPYTKRTQCDKIRVLN